MQFLFPAFLFAGISLLIPVIIHLFHFRRFKKVYFTNVRFLKEVKEESSARSRLRNILVLISRCLAFLFLVFGFAQPFISQNKDLKKGIRAVSIYIDNSFSMGALSQDVSLLDKAKQRAREIVQAYAEEDRFQILTNDFEGRQQRLVSKEDALSMIDGVQVGPSVKQFSQVLSRQKQVLQTGATPNKQAFLLSDFQKNAADFNSFQDTTFDINLIPLHAVEEKNLAIDSAWFEAPVQMMNQVNKLLVRVTNYGNENAENVRLTLDHDKEEKPVGSLNIPAHGSAIDTVPITILHTGWHEAKLKITDYPVLFDDEFYFTFHVPENIKVLVVNESSPDHYLDAALNSIKVFKTTTYQKSNIDYSSLPEFQLIILNNLQEISSGLSSELSAFLKQGGNVIVIPNSKADLSSYRSFFSSLQAADFQAFDNTERQVSAVNTDEFIFNDVFLNKNNNLKLPVTKGNFRLSAGSKQGETLMSYRDGQAFITKNKVESGNLYTLTSPLDDQFNNLGKNGEVFIPFLYKASISASRSWQIAYTIGLQDYIETDEKPVSQEAAFKIKGSSGEFIPEQRAINKKVVIGVRDQIKNNGFYQLFIKPGENIAEYAFNFDRRESKLEYLKNDEIKSQLKTHMRLFDGTTEANFTHLVDENNRGTTFWRWCLVLALVFLLTETLLLRFWKV